MFFKLKYGKGEVRVEFPHSVEMEVIEPALLPALGDVHDALLSALEVGLFAFPRDCIILMPSSLQEIFNKDM